MVAELSAEADAAEEADIRAMQRLFEDEDAAEEEGDYGEGESWGGFGGGGGGFGGGGGTASGGGGGLGRGSGGSGGGGGSAAMFTSALLAGLDAVDVLCPVCEERYLRHRGSVFSCKCGMTLPVKDAVRGAVGWWPEWWCDSGP
jgi:hypothetical protein